MNKFTYLRAGLLFSLLSSYAAFGQLSVNPNQTAAVLATKLAGPGISIASPVLTCPGAANGLFYSVTTPVVIDSGVLLTSGKALSVVGPESALASINNGAAGDAALTVLAGTATHDACVLEFDFVPNGDTVSFNYQFGSEEYVNSVCGQYNDAFAFFISGPGIVGSQNMALVPGTNIPVTVNSINNGVPGPPGYPGFCNIANCTSMGPGSPFTSYYVDNTGGTQLTYKGLTTRLRAVHDVTPCNSYHLKMAVADASNFLYDSGVFIEAGSLKTNNYSFSHTDSMGHTINGIPHTIVKGCSPATITVLSSRPVGVPHTVGISYGGTAVAGVDFNGPTGAVMPAGDTFTTISITPLPTAVAGPKTIEIYLQSPFSCGGNADTVVVNIIDSPTVAITTGDTSICQGAAFQIHASGTTGLVYSWGPAAGLSGTTVLEPTAAPGVTTTYVLTATLPLAGCTPLTRSINVYVDTSTINIFTPDTSICQGASVHIMAATRTGLTYSWSPATSLDNPTAQNPVATPNTTTTYSLTTTSTIGGCPAYAQITVTIVIPTINVVVPNMFICVGASANIQVNGDPTYNYSWSPATYLDNPNIQNPTSTPDGNFAYTVTATVPGTPCMARDYLSISFLPQVIPHASGGKSVCISQAIELVTDPSGNDYSYQWSGPAGFSSALQNPFIPNAQPQYGGIYSVTVTNTTTGCNGTDTTLVVVGNGSLSLKDVTKDQTIPYGSSVQLNAQGGVHYYWTPNDGTLDNPNINNPMATPLAKTIYTVYAHDSIGCLDTASVTIDVTFDDGVLIPTAFTPNGDGLNDVFRVTNLGNFKLAEMSVFNRWGEVIYHTNDGTNAGWNGTNKGTPSDMGTYSYLIVLGKPDGTLDPRKGNVTLIR